MAEVLEDHIRLHLLKDAHAPLTPELGEELIDLRKKRRRAGSLDSGGSLE
jgi:hypothetical protein